MVQTDDPLPTPRIDEVLTQFRHRSRVLNVPTETPVQECAARAESATENHPNELRIKKLEQQVSQLFQKVQLYPVYVFFILFLWAFYFCTKTFFLSQAPVADGSKVSSAVQSVVRKAKRDTDLTSESEYDSAKENLQHSRVRKLKINAKKPVKGKHPER